MDELTKRIEKFLTDNSATPEEVKDVASDCLAAEMTMDAAQIQHLVKDQQGLYIFYKISQLFVYKIHYWT